MPLAARATDADRALLAAPTKLIDRGRQVRLEERGVGHAVDHERCEHFARVEQQQVAVRLNFIDVEVAGPQYGDDRVAMFWSSDDESRLARGETLAEKIRDRPAERRFILIEADGVKMSGRVEMRARRSRLHTRDDSRAVVPLRPTKPVTYARPVAFRFNTRSH